MLSAYLTETLGHETGTLVLLAVCLAYSLVLNRIKPPSIEL